MKYLISLFFLYSCSHPTHRVETKIADTTELKFCFIGDVGTDSPEQSKVAKALDKEKCHKIFILGDLIYPDGIKDIDDPQLENKFLKHYIPLTKKDLMPSITVLLGNHDYRKNPAAWLDVAKKYPEIIFPHFFFLEKVGDACFVALDTNLLRFIPKLGMASEQTEWLEKQYRYLEKKCSLKVAMTHHPYLNSGPRHGDSTGITKLFFEQKILGKFDYLFSGHEHFISDEGVKKGTRLLISGAAGNGHKGYRAGYIVLRLKDQKATYKITEL